MDLTEEQQLRVFSGEIASVARKAYNVEAPPEFLNPYFDAYKAAGLPLPTKEWIVKSAPANARDWMKDALKGKFRSLGKAPKWVDELDWQFYKGQPMVFQGQLNIPDAPDEEAGELYIFSIRHPRESDGAPIVSYRMIKQTKKGAGTEIIHYLPEAE